MDDKTQQTALVLVKKDDDKLSFWGRHRLSLLLIIAVIIAVFFTTVSVTMYNLSGAAQLDLSRPGYQSVSGKVEKVDNSESYSSSGAVNKDTIQEFLNLYDKQAEKAKSVDAFNGDPLNPEVLEFGTSNSEE